MANQKSDQITKLDAAPREVVRAQDMYGRVRHVRFSKTIDAGDIAVAETLDLCLISGGGRVIGGQISTDGMGVGATVDIGYAGATTRYLAAGDVANAGTVKFAETLAQNYGDLVGTETRMIATIGGAAFPAAKIVSGHFLVVQD